jgi:hypothetical protein
VKKKLLIGGLGVATALLWPSGLGTGATAQAITCPVSQLATVCGVADLVYSTVCYQPLPEVPSIGGVITIDLEGGAPVQCPQLPV